MTRAQVRDVAVDRSAPNGTIRRTVLGATLGSFVEYFDFAAYAALAPILATVFFPGDSPSTELLSTFAVFAVAFVVRPIGGIFWGVLGDRLGRRTVLAAVILVMAGSTALIGALPGYATIGVLAPALLVVLRCLQGFSAGGEIMGAATLVAEHAPHGRRAYLTSYLQIATAVATLAGTALAFGLTGALGQAVMVEWGWRIPFLLALPLGAVSLFIRLRIDEPPSFRPPSDDEPSPLKQTLQTSANRRNVVLAGGTGALQFVVFYLLLSYMPTYLQQIGVSPAAAFGSLAIATVVLVVATPFAGIVSDRIGRRRSLLGASIAFLLMSYPCFLLISSGSFWTALAGQLLLALPAAMTGANMPAAQTELFPGRIRYTGYALGMNVSNALFGGTAPFLAVGLIALTTNSAAPAFLLMFAAVCSVLVARSMKETAFDRLRP